MKLEVGMYVRYNDEISKIVDIDNKMFSKTAFRLDTFLDGMYQSLDCLKDCKASFDIIDLIKEGDYVNGYKVDFIQNNEVIFNHNHPRQLSIFTKNIKTIVTKEQFEKMAYKVGE